MFQSTKNKSKSEKFLTTVTAVKMLSKQFSLHRSLLDLNHLSTSNEGKDGFFMSKNEKLPENIKPEMIGEKRYVRISEGAKRYSVSPNTFRMMAAEAHAIIHVRRIVLIDTKMIDEYLEAFREE